MKKNINVIGVVLLWGLVALNGCTFMEKFSGDRISEAEKQSLVESYIQKGQAYEKEGNLVAAFEQYKLAITVSPEDPNVQAHHSRLEKLLRELAEKHYRDGLAFYRKGVYHQARQEFLAALRFWPDHKEAQYMVLPRNGIQAATYKIHTVKPGESLSKLAILYYGDYKKFPIIAEYNRMDDATNLVVGQKIKIPIIENARSSLSPTVTKTEAPMVLGPPPGGAEYIEHVVKPSESLSKLALIYYGDYKKYPIIARFNQISKDSFLSDGQHIKIPEIEGVSVKALERIQALETIAEILETEKPPHGTVDAEPKTAPMPEVDPVTAYLEHGIEMFHEKNFQDAIVEFNKVLNAYPDHREALNYISRAHFEQGLSLFAKENYTAAKTEFEASLANRKDCKECREYLRKSEEKILTASREHALLLFEQRQYPEAIEELARFLKKQPDDATAREYMYRSHLENGIALFQQKKYGDAIKAFQASLEYRPNCDKCREYLDESRKAFKAFHYDKGTQYFSQQELKNAIREWELVYALDPGYKQVRSNLEKARKLLKRVDEIRKSTSEGQENEL
jgi:tetratricopeptide (TPR) repeat protein